MKKILLLASAAVVGVVAAQPLPPGYVWGLANCGPAVNSSRLACIMCCGRAGRTGPLTPIEVSGCQHMCAVSTFPPPPGVFERINGWVWTWI